MKTDSTLTKSALARTAGQFSTFLVDNLLFGVDVLHVQEVLRSQTITAVPRAHHSIEGLINLRGQIVIAIDMRRRLGMRPRAEGQATVNLVVRTPDGPVSLIVDEIGDVLDLGYAEYEPPPANLCPAARELIGGIYRLEHNLLLILDIEESVEMSNTEPSPT